MTRKTEIIEKLKDVLKYIDGGRSPYDQSYVFNHNIDNQILSKFTFLQAITDFPTIMFISSVETREYIGGNQKFGFMRVNIRGLIYEEYEDSIEKLEDLIEDIEHIVDNFPKELSCVQDAFIESIETDEGVLAPYGSSNLNIIIRYQLEI